jgi:hypothetical protein
MLGDLYPGKVVHIASYDFADTGEIESFCATSVTVRWHGVFGLRAYERSWAEKNLRPGRLDWRGGDTLADVIARGQGKV